MVTRLYTPSACTEKRTDIVEALMVLGTDFNITNDFQQTSAQAAMFYRRNELLPLLDRTRTYAHGDGG
jgi:hypothetical protein